jgi:hypothetical protein
MLLTITYYTLSRQVMLMVAQLELRKKCRDTTNSAKNPLQNIL